MNIIIDIFKNLNILYYYNSKNFVTVLSNKNYDNDEIKLIIIKINFILKQKNKIYYAKSQFSLNKRHNIFYNYITKKTDINNNIIPVIQKSILKFGILPEKQQENLLNFLINDIIFIYQKIDF